MIEIIVKPRESDLQNIEVNQVYYVIAVNRQTNLCLLSTDKHQSSSFDKLKEELAKND